MFSISSTFACHNVSFAWMGFLVIMRNYLKRQLCKNQIWVKHVLYIQQNSKVNKRSKTVGFILQFSDELEKLYFMQYLHFCLMLSLCLMLSHIEKLCVYVPVDIYHVYYASIVADLCLYCSDPENKRSEDLVFVQLTVLRCKSGVQCLYSPVQKVITLCDLQKVFSYVEH